MQMALHHGRIHTCGTTLLRHVIVRNNVTLALTLIGHLVVLDAVVRGVVLVHPEARVLLESRRDTSVHKYCATLRNIQG